jgi:hypothetical protein
MVRLLCCASAVALSERAAVPPVRLAVPPVRHYRPNEEHHNTEDIIYKNILGVAHDISFVHMYSTMRRNSTAVQLSGTPPRERFPDDVSDPTDNESGGVAQVDAATIHPTVADLDWAERLAAYRNAIADAKGIKLERRWSRKSVIESWVKSQANATRSAMKLMLDELGDLPPADDKKAMRKYADAVVRHNSQADDK